MTITFIAVDIDGILLDGRSQLPDINRQAIVNARARGIGNRAGYRDAGTICDADCPQFPAL